MKKIDISKVIQLLANMGVIAGIVFLGIELRQNNQLLRAEAIGTVLETRMVRQEINMQNPHLVELIIKNRAGLQLSPTENYTLLGLHTRSLLGWQKDYFLFQEGILEEEYYRSNFRLMKNAFTRDDETYSLMDQWNTNWRNSASPKFREFIEQCILADCDSIPR